MAPISRILSFLRANGEEAVISLSDLPVTLSPRAERSAGPAETTEVETRPTWSCTGWGLPGPPALLPVAVVSYTTISPVSSALRRRMYVSVALSVPMGSGPWDPGFRPASCPVVFGLSSPVRFESSRSDCLAPLLPLVTLIKPVTCLDISAGLQAISAGTYVRLSDRGLSLFRPFPAPSAINFLQYASG